MVCTVQYNWLMTLAPTHEESDGLNEKDLHRNKIISQLSACDMTHVVSLDTNNQAKVFKESGDMSEEAFQFLTAFAMCTRY
jgi:hypothetical protein